MKTCAVIGLGYVGLGLAVALGKYYKVFGYDINEARIEELKQAIDKNNQISQHELKNTVVHFTSLADKIKSANFYIVVAPTPAHYELPDLNPLIKAVETLATLIKKDDVIVFESTVYPGATEEICIPILERITCMRCGVDFNVGYSPERINPGDAQHTLKNVPKIISAQNKKTLEIIQSVYSTVCDVVHPVSSIKIAEAIKILENTQRDVNIAVMNEFSKIMHALNIDMHEVIEGAKTKWSFLPFKPGFVGGHCISIDPLYLSFQAKSHSVQPELIQTARKINDDMTQFVIQSMLKILVKNKIDVKNLKVGVLGVCYKENVNDMRNSLSLKLIKELKDLEFDCYIHDPIAKSSAKFDKTLELTEFEDLTDLTVIIITVAHDFYKQIGLKAIQNQCRNLPIIMDIPNLFIKESSKSSNLIYWAL